MPPSLRALLRHAVLVLTFAPHRFLLLSRQGALLGKEPKPYASFDEAVNTRLKSVTMWGGV